MRRAKFNWNVARDPSWLHWAATTPLLVGHIVGVRGSLELAISLCLVVSLGMWTRTRSVLAMPVQVRIAYAGLLAIGAAPFMFWIYIVQLVGTSAMVLFGYCPLVRMLSLFSWNRSDRIDRAWLTRLIWSSSPGGVVDFTERSATPAACSCSLAPPSLARVSAAQSAQLPAAGGAAQAASS
jgi:hypothetical protein